MRYQPPDIHRNRARDMRKDATKAETAMAGTVTITREEYDNLRAAAEELADIEAGRKTGSVHTLGKLAGTLGVTIDDLV